MQNCFCAGRVGWKQDRKLITTLVTSRLLPFARTVQSRG